MTVKGLLVSFITLLQIAILVRILLSWVAVSGAKSPFLSSLERALETITGPILHPIRRLLPPMGMMDFSPMVAIIVLWLIQTVISRVL